MDKNISSNKPINDLTKSRGEVSSDISLRITIGIEILKEPPHLESRFKIAQSDLIKWNDYNSIMLIKLFTDKTVYNEYNSIDPYVMDEYLDRASEVIYLKESIQKRLICLESIKEKLDLYSEPHSEENHLNEPIIDNQQLSKEVFIVHGHDESAKEAVARLIEKVGLEALILHEKPNKGRTIIKKFEDYSNVGFAVILLTPDDVGATKNDSNNLKSRARQNVILELGFFLGKLGIEKVCVLHKGDIEIPSDYKGVIYIPFDDHDGWRLKLVKELKAAGYDVNLNDIIK